MSCLPCIRIVDAVTWKELSADELTKVAIGSLILECSCLADELKDVLANSKENTD